MSRSRRALPFAAAGTLLTVLAIFLLAEPLGLIDDDALGRRVTTGAAGATTILVTRSPLARGRSIPRGFLGLSLEYSALARYAGTDWRRGNPVLEQLIRNLAPGQAPVLRIGGDSTDATWWPIRGMRRPGGVSYTLTRRRVAMLRTLALHLGARMIVGVNLEAKHPGLSVAEARGLIAALGRDHLAAVEIGNEPTNYSKFAYYRLRGRAVFGRGPRYDFARFAQDFSAVSHRLLRIPLAGPALGGDGWLVHLPKFLTAERGIAVVTLHRYPLDRCFTPVGSATSATLPNLLSPAASSGFLARIAPDVALAHAHRARFRLDEMNSVACGGKRGVSDTFASALWALDTLFEVARMGADGVNIHTFPGAVYGLFSFAHRAGRWSAHVRPEYYGLMMFARAAPPGAQLLKVVERAAGPLKAWATRSRHGSIRVVLINKSLTVPLREIVRVQGVASPATLERLIAPRAASTRGISLAGDTFFPRTYTGVPAGTEHQLRLHRTLSGYRVVLPPASAALLTMGGQ